MQCSHLRLLLFPPINDDLGQVLPSAHQLTAAKPFQVGVGAQLLLNTMYSNCQYQHSLAFGGVAFLNNYDYNLIAMCGF